MKLIFRLFYIFYIFLYFYHHTSLSQALFQEKDSVQGYLSDYRTSFDVTYYNLSIDLNIDTKSIIGSNKIYFKYLKHTPYIQIDLHENFTIDSISFFNNKIDFKHIDNAAYISTTDFKLNKINTIEIFYRGKPKRALNPPWDGGFVWKEDTLGRPFVGVACEGIGASVWWPCKDHLSDKPDSVQMKYKYPIGLTLVSNGRQLFYKNYLSHQESVWKVSYPIQTYNLTFYLGYFVQFNSQLNNYPYPDFSINYYVIDYNVEVARKHFQQVPIILKKYQELFGQYPFVKDGYALIEAPYWGMEHQSAIAYGNNYENNLADKLDFIIVHETGHEWWGNAMSADDYGSLWLHEAFCTYGELLLLEKLYDKNLSLQYLELLKTKIKNQQPIQGPIGVNHHEFLDADMYYKGAALLHTIRCVVNNDSLWFDYIKKLNTSFLYKNISTNDFFKFTSQYFKSETIVAIIKLYIYKARIPHLQYVVIKEGKRKFRMLYKWENFDGKLPVELLHKQKNIILYPSNAFWKTIIINSDELFFSNRNYYYSTEEVIEKK